MASRSEPYPASTLPLASIGGYRVVRELGQGGFGEVLEAEHVQRGERVALKMLQRLHPDALARFKLEFRALQDLHHPNLVRLRELLEHGGQWLIAMDLVEGTDWLSWVRPKGVRQGTGTFDRKRLLSTLHDICEGLVALHAAGLAHCDLKPANIAVAADGRAVLLDFGSLSVLHAQPHGSQDRAMGTAAYVAPEQATGEPVGPPADWYALGVCLYQALTGRLPFIAATNVQVLLDKQRGLPVPPSAVADAVPRELERLCMSLLLPDATERGGAAQVHACLGRPSGESPVITTMAPASGVRFAGRAEELRVLRRAYDDTLRGSPSQVFVEGESGVGKSALVEELLRRVTTEHPETLVLSGRCYENERVPFKGFDGVIDSLASHLAGLTTPECERVLPDRAKVLEQLFPVLGMVEAITRKPLPGIPAEPLARRNVALATLRELFERLREQRPVILVVDDLQWADLESFPIFEALTRGATPPGVLSLFTYRPVDEIGDALRLPMRDLRSGPNAQVLHLEGLPPSEARELAAQLLGPAAPKAWPAQIAEESEGHPLFVAELAQHMRDGVHATIASPSLEDVVRARLEPLDEPSRRLVDVVALAASPKPARLFYAAAGCKRGEGSETLAQLRAQRLVRTGRSGRVQCYHDRVRAVIVDLMSPEHARTLHAALGETLAGLDEPDAAEVGLHFDRGGRSAAALAWLARAADEALDNLSFGQAGQLYRRCLEVADDTLEAPVRCRLLVGLGHALASSGRSAEAARAYQQAAELEEREASVRLRVLAAQHLIQSAQIDEGLAAASDVLASLGTRMPTGIVGSVMSILWDRSRVALRGSRVADRNPEDVSDEARLVLDALMSLSLPVTWVDALPGTALTTRHLAQALSLGHAHHAGRALAIEATAQALQNPANYPRVVPLLERAQELADTTADPTLRAVVLMCKGSTAWFIADFETADAQLQEAEHVLRERCPGEPWLLTNVRMNQGGVCYWSGAHGRLAARAPGWIREAEQRGDAFSRAALVGMGGGYVRHLLRDDPQCALDEVRDAMEPWPEEPFSLAHWGELNAMSAVLSYQGGRAMWDWYAARHKRLSRSLLLMTGMGFETLCFYRANAALSALGECARHEERKLHAVVRRDVWRLGRSKTPMALGHTALLRAQQAALVGDRERALGYARTASEHWQRLAGVLQFPGMYLVGLLEGGEAGEAKRETALRFFARQGYAKPGQALRWGLPAMDSIANSQS